MYASYCDHCAISNHSVAICHRMSATHNLAEVGHFECELLNVSFGIDPRQWGVGERKLQAN